MTNMSISQPTDQGEIVLDFSALLLDTLGFTPDEFVSIGHDAGGEWSTAVMASTDAPEYVTKLPSTANIFFGVNPVRGPARSRAGRGKAEDVTRVSALIADLDVGPCKCPDLDTAEAIGAELSKILGTRTSAITYSGNGLHPYWPISDAQISDGDVGAAQALVRRFGRLVAVVADQQHGAKVDNVSDLSRMLRVPGTLNCKATTNGQGGIPVVTVCGTGKLMTLVQIDERLGEVGICAEDDDPVGDEVISPEKDWRYIPGRDCRYIESMQAGWATDTPSGRNPWMFNQHHRIAAAHRVECFPDQETHQQAIKLLHKRFRQLLATQEPIRAERRYEFRDAQRRAIERVTRKTDEQARAELGGHEHPRAELDEPIPLTQRVEIPPFPVDALPDAIADMVLGVAEATQTDPAMSATSALSALSACTGGRAEIEIRPGWREPLNIYTATIAASGERKSTVQRSMVNPIHDTEKDLRDAGIMARLEAETNKQVATKAAAAAIARAANADPAKDNVDALKADARAAAAIAEAIEVPAIPRLVADDITPEAVASLLAEQGGRLAIISAEGGILDIIAGRYSKVPNMDVWLKGHCGDPLKVDRKGRPPEYIRRPALTLGLMIRPQVLSAIAAQREFRGRGFLARILYAYPVSKVGRRTIAPPPTQHRVKDHYGAVVAILAAGMAGWVGDPAVLMLTPGAQEAITAVEAAVEPTLAGDGELASLADWGGKYVGAIARIAGIIHLAEHGADQGPRKPVDASTIAAAARIGEYFKACAINAFAEMGTDPLTADAAYLLERIRHLGVDEISERDLHSACQSRFPTKADLLPVLRRLVEHGYLAVGPKPKATGGRPASPRYTVREVPTKGAKGTEVQP